MRWTIALALLAGVAGASQAQEFTLDRTRLYVTNPAACQSIEENGVDAWMDLDFLSLSFQTGIQSMEFHCNFFDVKDRPNSNFAFVSAICELPGEVYPDTLAITPFDEKTIQVVSSHDSAMIAAGIYQPSNEGTSPGATVFHRCDNLSEIPFD